MPITVMVCEEDNGEETVTVCLFARVNAPVLIRVASPERATPVATFDAQGEAVQSARHLASITDAELLVMNADGTLASRESGELRATA